MIGTLNERISGCFDMTANCPMCGGKWDDKGMDYEVLLRCGDEHDIYCHYCKSTIEFVLSRDDLERTHIKAYQAFERIIKDLERQLKNAKEKLL